MSGWAWFGVGLVVWGLLLGFVLLGAAWNKANDEEAQRMGDRHYSDEDKDGKQ